jgi:hypothetical protein
MDKEQVYYVLTNCGISDRTIKFHIENTYNPPRICYDKVTSDVYHIQDKLFDAKTGEEDTDDEYMKDLRFEYDLKDEVVYIYCKTNLDPEEKLLYALTKRFIENHFEPSQSHLKIDVDLTLPGQQKCPPDATDTERFKIYIKNTSLTMIELNDKYNCGYRFYGGHDYCNDVHLREWSMQANLRLETMCYDASKDFASMVSFTYFKDTNIAYFKFWDQTGDGTTATLKYEMALTKNQLERLGVRIVSNI